MTVKPSAGNLRTLKYLFRNFALSPPVVRIINPPPLRDNCLFFAHDPELYIEIECILYVRVVERDKPMPCIARKFLVSRRSRLLDLFAKNFQHAVKSSGVQHVFTIIQKVHRALYELRRQAIRQNIITILVIIV